MSRNHGIHGIHRKKRKKDEKRQKGRKAEKEQVGAAVLSGFLFSSSSFFWVFRVFRGF
jgi:hypothetical protein